MVITHTPPSAPAIILRFLSKYQGFMTHSQTHKWQTKSLGEICDVVGGGTPRTAISKYWDGNIVWVTPKDLGSMYNIEVVRSSKCISSEGLKSSSAKLLPIGAVILSSRAPIGHVAIAGVELATNQGCRSFICGKSIFNKYLYYFLKSNTKLLNDMGSGSTFKEISGSKLKTINISFPESLPEQKRLVSILDEAFVAIEKAKENAQKNLQNAQEVFESHLESVFNKPGDGWMTKTLGDVCQLFQGLCINAKTKHLLVAKSNLPLLRIKDLRNNSAEQFVAESGWPKNSYVNDSEIIYTRTGQIGLVFRGRSGVLHNNCFKIKPSPVLNNDYLFWWLQNPAFRARITTLASKAAQPDITHTLFKMQTIQVPPRAYQDSSINLINQMRNHTQRLQSLYTQKLSALDELKQSLLKKAFSGEL